MCIYTNTSEQLYFMTICKAQNSKKRCIKFTSLFTTFFVKMFFLYNA